MENTIRVLIADEDKEFCAMLRETFCIDERMEIIGTYGDGNGLAQRILQDAPDVVLMDLVLPGVDGLTVLHELNEAEPAKMPVIFVVSSFASQETTEECNALGVSWHSACAAMAGRETMCARLRCASRMKSWKLKCA